MRQTRNQAKRAAKVRSRKHRKLRSTDGPQCPHCEPKVNGRLERYSILAKIAAREMDR